MVNEFLQFLMDYQNGIYVVLGLLLLIYLKKLISAIIEWKSTIFGLEKESAQGKLNSSLVMVVLLVLLLAAEFLIVTFVIPEWPQVIPPSETPAPAEEAMISRPEDVSGSSLVIRSTPEGGSAQPAGNVPAAGLLTGGCIEGQLEWHEPAYGEVISGNYFLNATVNVKDMAFYEYLYAPLSDPDNWSVISGGDLPIIEGTLGLWATSEVPNGNYILHLRVYGLDNQPLPACDVSIRVENSTD